MNFDVIVKNKMIGVLPRIIISEILVRVMVNVMKRKK